MSLLGYIVWLVFGGLVAAIGYFFLGCVWCLSIIGIPIGLQCFKFAELAFCPFDKEVRYGGGTGSFLLNIVWLFLGGLEMALGLAGIGLVLCITVIGIPFGLQFFKLAKLALMPLGAEIIEVED
ncbi:MAG: YccF domain-containing protein [Lachnospiraceae bacterium]|nr:YccF domain-containing protein [Lachnospiraceae bacterium]